MLQVDDKVHLRLSWPARLQARYLGSTQWTEIPYKSQGTVTCCFSENLVSVAFDGFAHELIVPTKFLAKGQA